VMYIQYIQDLSQSRLPALFCYVIINIRNLESRMPGKVKVILRLIFNQPVCLGVRHPSGARDKSFPFFNYFYSCGFVDVGRRLWREDESVICSAMTEVQFQVILRPTVCWTVRLGSHDQIVTSLFDKYFLSSRCRAPSPISPMNRVIQSKVKVTLV
jgi:hypothetical protein